MVNTRVEWGERDTREADAGIEGPKNPSKGEGAREANTDGGKDSSPKGGQNVEEGFR